MAKIQYRSVLSLCLEKKSVTMIAQSLGTTPKTMRRVRDKAIEMELLPYKWRRYSEDDLHNIMNPQPGAHEVAPYWEEIHDELGRNSPVSMHVLGFETTQKDHVWACFSATTSFGTACSCAQDTTKSKPTNNGI